MKNKKKYILIIFIMSIFIMLVDSGNGYIKGHDTDFHSSNISSIVEQMDWNNLLVQEPLGKIANNFGYGTRFFYPPLPHLTAAYIAKLFDNLILGMRATQWITFLASGITFFFLTLKIFKNEKTSTLLSLFYMSAPYHLSQIFIRDAFSEMFIPVAIPLIILGLLYLIEKNYKRFFICFIAGYTIAIYSHMAMTIYFTIMILVTFFVFYFKEIFTKKNIFYLISASVIILLLTAAFWMPMLEIKLIGNYVIFIPYFITAKGDMRFSVISIFELIRYLRPHSYDFIRYNTQLFVTVMFFASIILIIKKKLWKEKLWRFLLLFTILSIVMVTKYFPWYYTPDILQTLQFPWRLAIYIAFGGILVSGIFLKYFENKKYFNIMCYVLLFLSFFGAYFNKGHLNETTLDVNNINYSRGVGNQAEYLPEKTLNNKEYYNNRTNDIITFLGSGEIKIIEDDMPTLTFDADITTDSVTIELPRLYYMGYKLKVNGKDVELQESDNGFLQATITQQGRYTLTYEGTTVMKFANILSLVTALCLCVIVVLKIKFKKKVYLLEENNVIF